MTFTSHFQSSASLRKTAVWGMSRLAMLRTRSACSGSLLTLPLGASVWITCWYWAAAALSSSADETRRSWLRWTPTVPCSVVVEHAASAATSHTTIAVRLRVRPFIAASCEDSMIEAHARGSRTLTGRIRGRSMAASGALAPRSDRFSPKEDGMDRRDVLAERPLESGRGFMPGVSVNPSRILFTAGLTGRGPDGNLVAGGMGPQARRTFERLQGVLSR